MNDVTQPLTERPHSLSEKALQRFLAKVSANQDGCWMWIGTKNHRGYGQFYLGRQVPAHRAAYGHYVGPIPDGFDVDHLCRVRSCVNPMHLEAVPHIVNIRRKFKGSKPTHNADGKPQCRRGHEMSPQNLYVSPKGRKECQACLKERSSKRSAARVECDTCGSSVSVKNLARHRKSTHVWEARHEQ